MNYIGIDVSKKLIHVYNKGKQEYTKLDNNVLTISEFFKSENPETLILYEATGIYSKALEKALNDLRKKHFHIHASDLHGLIHAMGNHNKTDRLDCKYIAEMGAFLHEHTKEFGSKDKLIKPTSNSLNTILALMTEIRRIKHINAQIKQAFETIDNNVYSSATARSGHQTVMDEYKVLLAKLYAEIKSHLAELGATESLDHLITIPGISEVVGVELVVFFLSLQQKGFQKEDIKKVISYTGLNPIERQSGSSVNQTLISKRGNKFIRSALYMPGVVRYNLIKKDSYKDTNLAKFFVRIKQKFCPTKDIKRGKSVITAMSKKILCVARGIFWNNTAYNFS